MESFCLLRDGVILFCDNVRPHMTQHTQNLLQNLVREYWTVFHTHLVSSYFCLFPTLKKHFSGQFHLRQRCQTCCHHMADVTDIHYVHVGWINLSHAVTKCFNHQGGYVENLCITDTFIMYWQFHQLKSCL
jgi:hypothetical protein